MASPWVTQNISRIWVSSPSCDAIPHEKPSPSRQGSWNISGEDTWIRDNTYLPLPRKQVSGTEEWRSSMVGNDLGQDAADCVPFTGHNLNGINSPWTSGRY